MEGEIEENPGTINNGNNNINNYELTNDSHRIENNKQVTNSKIVKKQYSCNICNKSFIRKIYFDNHLRRHENEYICVMCNKRFAQSDSLKTHLLIHTDEKMHQCNLCERRFSRKCHLVNHLRTHTKQQSYQQRSNDSKTGIIQQPQIRKFTHDLLDEEDPLKIENDNCNKSIGNERDNLSDPLHMVNSTINAGTNENEIINEISETNRQLNDSVIKEEMIEIEEHPVKSEDPIENDANGKLSENQQNLFIKKSKPILQHSLKNVLQKSIANSQVVVNVSTETNTAEECMNESNRVEHSLCTNDEDNRSRDTLEIDNNKQINVTKLEENVETDKIDKSCHISSNNDNLNLPICNDNSKIMSTNKTDHMEDHNHFGKNPNVDDHTVTTIVGQNSVTDDFLTEESIDVVEESSEIEFQMNNNEHKGNCTYNEKNSTQTDTVNEINETKQLYDSIEKEEMIEIEEHPVKIEDQTDNNTNEKLSHNQKSLFVKGAKLLLQHTLKTVLQKSIDKNCQNPNKSTSSGQVNDQTETNTTEECMNEANRVENTACTNDEDNCSRNTSVLDYYKNRIITKLLESMKKDEIDKSGHISKNTDNLNKESIEVVETHSVQIENPTENDATNRTKSILQHTLKTVLHKSTDKNDQQLEQLSAETLPYCEICCKEFASNSNLKKHLERHATQKLYNCKFCSKKGYTIKKLKRHLNVHRLHCCPICNRKCRKRSTLKAHLRMHSDERPYECDVCEMKFRMWKALKLHLKQHIRRGERHNEIIKSILLQTVEWSYLCDICGTLFRTRGELSNHLKVHTHEKKCKTCGKIFRDEYELKQHLTMHTNEEPYRCDICGKQFVIPAYLRKHLKVHAPDGKCKVCGKIFLDQPELKQHLIMHTNEEPYRCDICGKEFVVEAYLKKHLKAHTRGRKCKTCSKIFRDRHELKQHLTTHTNERPYQCDICGKQFAKHKDRQRHFLSHKTYQCKNCDEKFQTLIDLRKHSVVHPQRYTCDTCGKEFTYNSSYKYHLKLHTGEGLYKCDHCPKKFPKIYKLKQHLLRHTDERNYKCNVCDRKFLSRYVLKKHAIVHTGEQPYSCDTCGKKFSRKDNLRTHLKIHTGEKPFQCNICDKRFLYKHVFRDHLKVHTGEKSFDCKKCGVSFLQKADLSAHNKQEHKKK